MRLIDAENILKEYEHIDWYCVSKEGQFMRGATTEDNPLIHYYDGEEIIKNAPTVDAVEVVRCKDCKHSILPSELTQRYGKPGTLTCHNRYSPCNRRNVSGDDFCSYGERRDKP